MRKLEEFTPFPIEWNSLNYKMMLMRVMNEHN